MVALLALPFSGGAFTFILRVSFNQPATQSCDDEGRTFICSFTFSGFSYRGSSDLSTRRQFSSSRVTSYFAQRANSFFVITSELRLLAPAITL